VVANLGFSPKLRLITAAQYKQVFANPTRSSDAYFTLLAIGNQLEHPRLGLAIAKKQIKRAVDRNYLKRIARESFRLQQHQIAPLDIVVLARKEAAQMPADKLRRSLERHWRRLVVRCNLSSSF
jgi:ribonuclease P protein component